MEMRWVIETEPRLDSMWVGQECMWEPQREHVSAQPMVRQMEWRLELELSVTKWVDLLGFE